MRITTQEGSLLPQVSGQSPAPAQLWPGYTDTTSIEFSIWPPNPSLGFTVQGVQWYNIYRDGVRIYGDGVGGAAPGVGVNSTGVTGVTWYPWYVDNTLAPGEQHNYTARAVVNNTESPDSPVLTAKASLNGPSILPTAPTNPSTWVQPLVFPTGGTTWIVNNTTAGGNVAGSLGPTGKLSVGCGFQYALTNANIHGGDILECQAGQAYPTNAQSGYTFPAFDGTNGFTVIVSDQCPEYRAFKGLTGGTLPPASTYSTKMQLLPFQLTAAPAINATSATLSSQWTLNTGLYFVFFPVTGMFVLNGYEERQVLFTHGSSAIDWNPATSGAVSNNLYPQAGLRAAATSTLIQVAYGSHVTDVNIPSMPSFTYTTTASIGGFSCFNFPGPTELNNVRFIGINVRPTGPSTTDHCGAWIHWPNANGNSPSGLPPMPFGSTPADSVYFDRCLMGIEPGDPNYVEVIHGMGNIFCNHFMAHQSQFYGCSDSITGVDSNALLFSAGGPNSIDNCYISAGGENMIAGGIPCDPIGVNNMAYHHNLNHKPLAWFDGGVNGNSTIRTAGTGYARFGYFTKNLFELKVGTIWDVNNNLLLNCAHSNEPDYYGAAFALGARDQAANSNNPLTTNDPQNRVADINIHDNDVLNCASAIISFSADQGTSSLYDARVHFSNNRCHLNPPLAGNAGDSWHSHGSRIAGPCVDHIIDQNTFIVNTASPGMTSAIGIYFYTTPGYSQPSTHGVLTPNGWSVVQDRLTLTNNIYATNAGGVSAAFHFDTGSFANYPNLNYNQNLLIGDATNYHAGSLTTAALSNVGFKNFQGVNVIPVNPDDWNVISGTYATASTTGGPLGATFVAAGSAVQITTLSLPNAQVGTDYVAASALTASGGSGNYLWNVESASPNKHLWFHLAANGQPFGIPQYDTTGQGGVDTVVIRCTDAANPANTVTAPFTINIVAGGALTIFTSPVLATGAVGSGWTHQLRAGGGAPPYNKWKITGHTGSNAFYITNNGWLSIVGGAIATAGDTVSVSCEDAAGTAAPATYTVVINSTIQLADIDYILKYPGSSNQGVLRLPPARMGHKYKHTLHAANGGTGAGQVWSVVNGSLPAGLALNQSTGVITGTPSSAGNSVFSISVTDSGPNTSAAVPCHLNVGATSIGTRPPANTAAGFFVDKEGGNFCGPGGHRFPYYGLNRNNSLGNAGSAWTTSGANMVRHSLFTTNFRGANTGTSMATYAGYLASHIALGEYGVMANFWRPGTTGAANNLTGGSTSVDLGLVAAWWCDNVAAWNSALQNKAGINPQNEWGPTSQNLQFVYAAAWDGPVGTGTTWKMPIASVNATTGVIVLQSGSATHPLANCAQIGWVFLAGGGVNVAVQISTTVGGSTGAWTVTATTPSVLSAYTSGGTISGGLVGMLRAAGYTDPLHIDVGAAFGQRIDTTTNYGPAIAQSDPLQNVVLAYHAYNNTVNYVGRISSVSTGNNAVIHYNDAAATHPMDPTGVFANISSMRVTGVNGLTGINGTVGCTGNGLGGSQNLWTTATTATTTGTYTSGGLAVPGVQSGVFAYHHIDPLVTALAALQQSGIGASLEEWGNSNSSGSSAGATPLCVQEVVQAGIAAQIPITNWAMDDTTTLGISNGNPATYTYASVANGSFVYTTPSQLSATGIDLILNPRYGVHANAVPDTSFL